MPVCIFSLYIHRESESGRGRENGHKRNRDLINPNDPWEIIAKKIFFSSCDFSGAVILLWCPGEIIKNINLSKDKYLMVWNIYGLYGPREKWARGIKPKLHKRRCIKYDEYELNFTHFLIRQEHCFSCDYFLFIWLIPFTWSESRGSKPLSPFS